MIFYNNGFCGIKIDFRLLLLAFAANIAFGLEETPPSVKRVVDELQGLLAPHKGGTPTQQLDFKTLPNEPENLLAEAFIDILNRDANGDREYKKWLTMALLRYAEGKEANIREVIVNGLLDSVIDVNQDEYGLWAILKFHGRDFNEAAKRKAWTLFSVATRYPQVIRLTGLAGLEQAVPRLRDIAGNLDLGEMTTGVGPDIALHPDNVRWSAAIAMARLGDSVALSTAPMRFV